MFAYYVVCTSALLSGMHIVDIGGSAIVDIGGSAVLVVLGALQGHSSL